MAHLLVDCAPLSRPAGHAVAVLERFISEPLLWCLFTRNK